jgi:hypothetical protein
MRIAVAQKFGVQSAELFRVHFSEIVPSCEVVDCSAELLVCLFETGEFR